MVKKGCQIFLIFIAAFFICSCGIEDVPYLYPIPDGDIRPDLVFGATVLIPSSNDPTFTHWAIFYKIYVSDILTNTPLAMMATLNPTLGSDWNAIVPHIDSDTAVPIRMDDFFRGRRFFPLELQYPDRINTVLSSSVFGDRLRFEFPSMGMPTMTVMSTGTTYTLWRSIGPPTNEARPDRYFRNRPELSGIIETGINVDVAPNTTLAPGARIVTYVAMFIVAMGRDHATQTVVNSTPSLINIFRLPD